jgi:hypothetical protein
MGNVLKIIKFNIENQTLHNIAVDIDESYIASGVVVHNCKSYYQPVKKGKLKKEVTGLNFKGLTTKARGQKQFNEFELLTTKLLKERMML